MDSHTFVAEKEVYDCLVDSDQDFELWEELDDDFVTTVNDGKPALVLVSETEVEDDSAQ